MLLKVCSSPWRYSSSYLPDRFVPDPWAPFSWHQFHRSRSCLSQASGGCADVPWKRPWRRDVRGRGVWSREAWEGPGPRKYVITCFHLLSRKNWPCQPLLQRGTIHHSDRSVFQAPGTGQHLERWSFPTQRTTGNRADQPFSLLLPRLPRHRLRQAVPLSVAPKRLRSFPVPSLRCDGIRPSKWDRRRWWEEFVYLYNGSPNS